MLVCLSPCCGLSAYTLLCLSKQIIMSVFMICRVEKRHAFVPEAHVKSKKHVATPSCSPALQSISWKTMWSISNTRQPWLAYTSSSCSTRLMVALTDATEKDRAARAARAAEWDDQMEEKDNQIQELQMQLAVAEGKVQLLQGLLGQQLGGQ